MRGRQPCAVKDAGHPRREPCTSSVGGIERFQKHLPQPLADPRLTVPFHNFGSTSFASKRCKVSTWQDTSVST